MSREKRKILVTGGAGLIGSHIVEQVVRDNALGSDREVIVLDNFSCGRRGHLAGVLESGRVQVVEGDIRDRSLLAALLPDVDIVFHQAAVRTTRCTEEPRLALEVLVDGTFNVLDACVSAGVRKLVTGSSAAIYGLADIFPANKSHDPWNNRTLHGASKVFNEGLLRSFHDMYGLDYVALRYFNVYGPRMDIHGDYTNVLVRWMELIDNGKTPLIHGDSSAEMDFVFVSDIANASILAAKSDVTDEVVNVGACEDVSMNEVLTTLLRVMSSVPEPGYGPGEAVDPTNRYLLDTETARELLGFEARISLEEGLQRLVDWWKKAREPERVPEAQGAV